MHGVSGMLRNFVLPFIMAALLLVTVAPPAAALTMPGFSQYAAIEPCPGCHSLVKGANYGVCKLSYGLILPCMAKK
jgi:hypothetical protein